MSRVDPFALVAGLVLVVGGAGLLVVSLFFWPAVIYGVIALILGMVILITLRKQDEIEQIRTEKNKKSGAVRKR